MEVRHNITGKDQAITKDEFEVLKTSGHAKNFTILNGEDFSPPELSLDEAESTPAESGKKGKAAKE